MAYRSHVDELFAAMIVPDMDESVPALGAQTVATNTSTFPRPPLSGTARETDEDSPPPPTLLTIPRELRDEIYKYTFSGETVDITAYEVEVPCPQSCKSYCQKLDFTHTETKGRCNFNGGLALTCKQLYDEAADSFYKHTYFRTRVFWEFKDWLSKVPARHKRLISRVSFHTEMFGGEGTIDVRTVLALGREEEVLDQWHWYLFEECVQRFEEQGLVFKERMLTLERKGRYALVMTEEDRKRHEKLKPLFSASGAGIRMPRSTHFLLNSSAELNKHELTLPTNRPPQSSITSLAPAPSAMTKKDESSPPTTFFSLPRELRDEIYEHTFTGNAANIRPSGCGSFKGGLALTCTQLYHECLEYYYKRTSFNSSSLDGLVAWLKSVHQKHSAGITKITCHTRLVTDTTVFGVRPRDAYKRFYTLQDMLRKTHCEHWCLRRLAQHLKEQGVRMEDCVFMVDTEDKIGKTSRAERRTQRKLEKEAEKKAVARREKWRMSKDGPS